MKFSSLVFSMNNFASKLMGISTNAQNKISGFSSNELVEGSNSFFDTIWQLTKTFFADSFKMIYELLVQLVVSIAQWVLVAIDFGFVFIREFIGMNVDYDSTSEITEGDIIFQFLFNETVINVIKGMIGLAIVLIILFGVFAIIKSEYKYATEGGNNSKKSIFVSILKSLFLLIFVPIVAIGGIIMSNAILKSVYMATAGGTDVSMGTQIFVTSGYTANVYRKYADTNLKVPITFNFEDIEKTDNITGWDSTGGVEELDEALRAFTSSSVWNRGLTTYLMFQTDAFLKMSDVDDLDKLYTEQGKVDPYHTAYDLGLHTRTEEYHVMADVVEYVLKHNRAIYFKTAQEIYDSYMEALETVPSEAQAEMIKINEREGLPIAYDGKNYTVKVKYDGDAEATEYVHKKDEVDEAKGAVYLIALEQTVEYEIEGEKYSYSYYYPLISSEQNFATYYHDEYPVIAKGLFDEGENPTAITQEDGVVKFYRDKLNVPTILDVSLPRISYERPEGTTEDLGVFLLKKGISAVTGVDISQFIPYIYYNYDIFSLFRKQSYDIAKLEDGRFYITYFITKGLLSGQENVTTGLNFDNVYDYSEFNIIVLLLASALLIGQILKIVFGLASRVLDVMLLAISYPAVISTIPLDNSSRFNEWKKVFIQKIVSIYGVVIAFNLILIVIPAIYEIQFITPTMVMESFTIKGWVMKHGVDIATKLLNLWLETLFVLVAFSLIGNATKLVDSIVDSSGGIVADGENIIKNVKKVPETIGKYVSGEKLKEVITEGYGTLTRFIPGIGIVDYAKDRKHQLELMGEAGAHSFIKMLDPSGITNFVADLQNKPEQMMKDAQNQMQDELSGKNARQEAEQSQAKRKEAEAGDGPEQTGDMSVGANAQKSASQAAGKVAEEAAEDTADQVIDVAEDVVEGVGEVVEVADKVENVM